MLYRGELTGGLHAGLPAARAASAPVSSLEAARRRLESLLQASPERPCQPVKALGAGYVRQAPAISNKGHDPKPAGPPAGRKRPRYEQAASVPERNPDKAEVPALPTPALEGRQPRASESA